MRNVSASVRQQLLNKSRSGHRPFNELLQYYAMERFLYRLSKSVHAHSFILKGALMLRVWHSPEFRPTMDIDLLGTTSNEKDNIISQILDIIAYKVEPDGLTFDPESIQTESIIQDADYNGIRIRFLTYLVLCQIISDDVMRSYPEFHTNVWDALGYWLCCFPARHWFMSIAPLCN